MNVERTTNGMTNLSVFLMHLNIGEWWGAK